VRAVDVAEESEPQSIDHLCLRRHARTHKTTSLATAYSV